MVAELIEVLVAVLRVLMLPSPPPWAGPLDRLGLRADPKDLARSVARVYQVPISARVVSDGLELRGPAGLALGLELRERQIWSRDGGPESGDESFDAVVVIEAADELLVSAALDAEARRAGLEAVSLGAVLEGGRWTCLLRGPTLNTEAVQRAMRALARAHRALDREELASPISGAGRVLLDDPDRSVRARVLERLDRRGLVDASLLERLAASHDPSLRFFAATRTGDRASLADLARTGSRTWRVSAASALAPLARDPGVLELVEQVLVGALADPELSVDASRCLGEWAGRGAADALRTASSDGPTPQAREAARAALDRLRGRWSGGLASAGPGAGALTLPETASCDEAER